jgi:catechol 2,3-dioxygenase-like lactoylglutathione lyase family enzyme
VIHHVQLAAPRGSEEQQRAFWMGVLGFEEVAKPPALAEPGGGCWFRLGDVEIHVGVEDDFRPARKAHPGLLVSQLDRWATRLADAGCRVTWNHDLPGMRRFYSQDPFGNRLEFLEPEDDDRELPEMQSNTR